LLLEGIASGLSITGAAQRAGLGRTTVHMWRHADPEFDRELEAAYQEGTDRLADVALQRAMLPEHDALLIFMLKQRDPARFNRKVVEMQVTGDVNNPVSITHSVRDRPKLIILPDNTRPTLSEAEIIAEHEAIQRECMIGNGLPIEAEAETEANADDTIEQAEPDGWQTITIKRRA
jgi:hypothetical protein